MNQEQPTNKNASTSERLKDINDRRNRAILKAVGVALLAWIVAFAIYAGLKSIHSGSTLLDIILLLWNAVIVAAPFVGVWVYKKNK